MNAAAKTKDYNDPVVPDWTSMELAETWPDTLDLAKFGDLIRFFGLVMGKRQSVRLPASLPGKEVIPKYVLQEFHNLPNGNYSCRFSRGYITGFDLSMLGYAARARRWIAERLQHCSAVVDVGTAGGKTARAIKDAGVAQVWGVDPSPYLLKHAAADHPPVSFIHGVAENLPFDDERLDGISACFLFHELPPRYARQALASFHRVLKSGAHLVIAEPSERQLEPLRFKEFFQRDGWLKLYFKGLAHFVHEPFLDAWHQQNKRELFAEAGFELIEEECGMPLHLFHLIKR